MLLPEELSPDQPILVSAPTGKGKPTFVSETLARYAAETDKKVLLVSKGQFDFFVLDKVHVLQSDASFTPCTGKLLEWVL